MNPKEKAMDFYVKKTPATGHYTDVEKVVQVGLTEQKDKILQIIAQHGFFSTNSELIKRIKRS